MVAIQDDAHSILLASEHDVPAIRVLIRASILGLASGDYSQEVLDNWGANSPIAIARQTAAIREGREITWVARASGDIIGFSALDPHKAVIRAVYVHPKVARRGIGTRLLETLEAKAELLGLSRLTLVSSITAKAFYERHGYRNIDERESLLSTGTKMASYLMEKALD